jgi:formylmethanofuran dehydrogenase subunit D
MPKISTVLDNIKSSYDTTINLVDGLSFSQKDTIKTIEYYTSSKYLNGQKDELGRDKPFFQILNAICDVENAAKDVDTKDISVTSDDGNHYLESWLMSKDIQVWMKEVNFAKTLNDMRDIHTRYGSLLVKKVEKKDEDGKKMLYLEMPEWKNTITDQVNIIQGAIVETHWMTPVELSKMTEWKNIDEVVAKCKGVSKRIPIYEIRGEFSQATIKDCENKKYTPEDEKKFSYQLYYIAGDPSEPGEIKDISKLTPLYWEDNTERVYKYLARKKRAGRAFGVGVMEEGEEAQVWANDAVLKQHRAMEYTTKVIGQSASKKLKGRNLLTETDDGTILEHEDGKPITALNLLPAGGLQQYNNLIQQWNQQLEKTTSAYAAQRGETPPSGTPFRLQATVLQQSSSVFKTLQQEFGIFLTEIFEDWVMPYLASRLNKEHILAYEFSPDELKDIDKRFTAKEAGRRAVQMILGNKPFTQEDYDAWLQVADELIKKTKGQRFIDIPKDFYKDFEAKVTVNITGEQRNKAATLESLNNILTVYASNPNLSQDPVASQLLTRIIELSGAGISPAQITAVINEKAKNDAVAQAQMAAQQTQQVPQKKLSLTATGANTNG